MVFHSFWSGIHVIYIPKGRIMLQGKKVIVFGERDDISGNIVSNCLKGAGAEVIYENTACFV